MNGKCPFCLGELPSHTRLCYVGNLPAARHIEDTQSRVKQANEDLFKDLDSSQKKPLTNAKIGHFKKPGRT